MSFRKQIKKFSLANMGVRGVLVGIIVLVFGVFFLYASFSLYTKSKLEKRRLAWKETALQELWETSITNAEIQNELEALKTEPTHDWGRRWTGERVLSMTNGEYVVYSYYHGSGNINPHLFLGRASDGRWLYSTFHFCGHMETIRLDDQPGSISDFATKYLAREFDGKSDECLNVTWTAFSKPP